MSLRSDSFDKDTTAQVPVQDDHTLSAHAISLGDAYAETYEDSM